MITGKQKKLLVHRLKSESDQLMLEMMGVEDVQSEEYLEKWERLKKISGMLDEINTQKAKFEFNDKWIPIIGSLASILLIMNYEKADVLTTKATQFIYKGRG